MHYLGNRFRKIDFALGFDQEVEGMGQQQDVAEVLSVDRALLEVGRPQPLLDREGARFEEPVQRLLAGYPLVPDVQLKQLGDSSRLDGNHLKRSEKRATAVCLG